VPFCASVCPYCDFAVQTGGPAKRQGYVDSLLAEIDVWGRREPWAATQPFDTVYLGGGTPSALTADALEAVLAALGNNLPIVADPGVTLETNPEDVTGEHAAAWRDLGITRISLGVQSFDDETLRLLGRAHTSRAAERAVEIVLAAGFAVVSLDLIYGVPGQSGESWRTTLERAVDLGPHHISCYELTVHEGTPFFAARESGTFVEVNSDGKADLFFATHEFLADAGYPAYEVSNFARGAALRSRHNMKYWDHTPYLGLGPSAHSFDGGARRWWNARRLADWQAAINAGGDGVADSETLSPRQLALETLALGFRTTAGVDLEEFRRRYGVDLAASNGALLERLVAEGLLEETDGRSLAPTLKGLAMADTVAAALDLGEAEPPG